MREEILLTFTTDEGALGTGFHLVDLEVVEALDVLDEFIILKDLSWRARQMVTVVIIATVSEDFGLLHVRSW